jgi:hypothetical protein
MYLNKVSHDENLVTGQNPWSTWTLAETMIKQLGYTPKHRELTGEENADKVLEVFEAHGSKKAKELIERMLVKEQKPVDRLVLASHSVIAVMQGKIGRSFSIVGLTSYAKNKSQS